MAAPHSAVAAAYLESVGSKVSSLNGTEVSVLFTLLDFVNVNGWAWPSLEKVIALSGCTRSSVCRAYKGLETKGFVQRFPGVGTWFSGWPGVSIADRDLRLAARKEKLETRTHKWDQKQKVTQSQKWDQNKENPVPGLGLEERVHDLLSLIASLYGYKLTKENNNDSQPKAAHVLDASPKSQVSGPRSQPKLLPGQVLPEGALAELQALAERAQRSRQSFVARREQAQGSSVPLQAVDVPAVSEPAVEPRPVAAEQAPKVFKPKNVVSVLPDWLLPLVARSGCSPLNLVKLLEAFGEERLKNAAEVMAQTYPTDDNIKSSFGALLRRAAENGWTTRVTEIRKEKQAYEAQLSISRPPSGVVEAVHTQTGEVFEVVEVRAHGILLKDASGVVVTVPEASFAGFTWVGPEGGSESAQGPLTVRPVSKVAALPERAPVTSCGPAIGVVATAPSGMAYEIRQVYEDHFIARREDGLFMNVAKAHWGQFTFGEVSQAA